MQPQTVNHSLCRDCGSPLDLTSRGCQTCALNLEAESMIDRFVFRLLLSLIAIVVIAAVIFVYLRR